MGVLASRVAVLGNSLTKHIDTLVAASIPVRKTERATSYGFNTKIHHKNFVMEGKIDGVEGRRLVATGSQNATWSSHRFADESFMVLGHGPTVDVYEATFDRVDATSYRHPVHLVPQELGRPHAGRAVTVTVTTGALEPVA